MPMNLANYPADWKAISLRIRERDGNCCKMCGVPNGAYIVRDKANPEKWRFANDGDLVEGLEPDAIRVVLTVAHHPDPDPMNCADDNLHALCQLHHLRLDGKHHAANAKVTRQRKREQMTAESGQGVLL